MKSIEELRGIIKAKYGQEAGSALVECIVCKKQVARVATVCPNCGGQPQGLAGTYKALFSYLVFMLLCFFIMGTCTFLFR